MGLAGSLLPEATVQAYCNGLPGVFYTAPQLVLHPGRSVNLSDLL